MRNLSNHEETSNTPKSRDVLQNKWSIIFKSVKVLTIKERQALLQCEEDLNRHNN